MKDFLGFSWGESIVEDREVGTVGVKGVRTDSQHAE